MAKNAPTPGDTIVPSARAERRRMFVGDSSGIAIYLVAAGLVSVAILIIAVTT